MLSQDQQLVVQSAKRRNRQEILCSLAGGGLAGGLLCLSGLLGDLLFGGGLLGDFLGCFLGGGFGGCFTCYTKEERVRKFLSLEMIGIVVRNLVVVRNLIRHDVTDN